MLNLRVVQAEHGDCLILEYGSAEELKYVLIDGGPAETYQMHLKPVLEAIPAEDRSLQCVVLSHVDDDHIKGVLDLIQDLRAQHGRRRRPAIAVQELWHNTFSNIVDLPVESLEPDRQELFAGVHDLALDLVDFGAGAPKAVPGGMDARPESIDQGDQLTEEAGGLKLPINRGFQPERLISVDQAPRPVTGLEGLNLYVVGPSDQNLGKLRVQWRKWVIKQLRPKSRELGRELPEQERAPKPDESAFNLSSIMLLAEADDKRILLTGDGLGEDLIQGLEQAGVLEPGGTFHVELFKLPHHGSARNVSPELFRRVTAGQYVISANGKDGNPDLLTLQWLVEAAQEQGRAVEIVITNWTQSICELMRTCDPAEYGYQLVAMDPGAHSMLLKLVD